MSEHNNPASTENPETPTKASNKDAQSTQCPFCKETILKDAIKCKHCGSVLTPISENFLAPNSGVEGLGNRTHIVPNAQQNGYSAQAKPDHIIRPYPYTDTMLGHGWGVLIVAFIFSVFAANSFDPEEALGIAFIGAIIVVPWSIWLLCKPHANKILPVIALIYNTLIFLGVISFIVDGGF